MTEPAAVLAAVEQLTRREPPDPRLEPAATARDVAALAGLSTLEACMALDRLASVGLVGRAPAVRLFRGEVVRRGRRLQAWRLTAAGRAHCQQT